MYKSLIQPLLFLMDAEKAHHFTTNALKAILSIPGAKALTTMLYQFESQSLQKEVFGLKFKNPIGLAAGFDKEARFMHEMATFGFGFLEIGTITPKGQPGNPKPRMFRLKKDQALINRLGFNNGGVEMAIEKLKRRPENLIIGGNIGKNKATPNEEAYRDYEICLESLYPHVDYFVVNVSSPNTPNLRALQDKEPLSDLLNRLKKRMSAKPVAKPILLKIAPDLNEHELNDVMDIVDSTKISGLIATNTTISRSGLKSEPDIVKEAGGLSGKPLERMSTAIIRRVKKELPELPVIGVGGISDVDSAWEKMDAGAELVQMYTGFVYEGPGVIKKIKKGLINKISVN